MSDLSKIDKNFAVNINVKKDDIKFYNIDEAPFKIYGIFRENGRYRRMPEAVAKTVNEGVNKLHSNTAGGRLRFMTDSPYVAICAETENAHEASHMTLICAKGFDLYIGNAHFKSFFPPSASDGNYESIIDLGSAEMREITINFPLYGDVKKLYVGLSEGASVNEPTPYRNEKPVVFYGSSITQGGCASRPGTCYQGIISRRFNYDYINLGFSGSAKAEDTMIDYVKELDMSLFVYDYDHNASLERLRATHEKMFLAIRERHPSLPIIMMSRPKYDLNEEEKKRLAIIKATYENALARGDKNVYMLSGADLTALCLGEGTVDGTHPTDFGFASMAKALGDVMENIKI